MEDRFKFRVWDGKTFFYFNLLKLQSVGMLLQEGETLEQCIGHKDKTGKLIFMGDWVRLVNYCYKRGDGTTDRKTSEEYAEDDFGVVEYMQYNCKFMLAKRQHPDRLIDQWNSSIHLRPNERNDYELEIIGNVHQNPELLEAYIKSLCDCDRSYRYSLADGRPCPHCKALAALEGDK